MAAHGNDGGDNGDRSRDNNRSSQRSDGDKQNGNRWWKPWDRDKEKPKPPVDPATCAEWQARLDQWVANYKTTAGKDVLFGSDYTGMVQNFVTTQGLTVADYEAHLATVEAKKVTATTRIDAMSAPDLNCENDAAETTERGIDRSTFKDARWAMEDYKKSLKELTEGVRASYGGQGMM